MHHNQLIIDAVKRLYLRGLNHRQIEHEMRSGGCLTFTRRVLHSQKTKRGVRVGWIERFGWRKELERQLTAETRSNESLTAETQRRRGKKRGTMDASNNKAATNPSVINSKPAKNPSSSSPRLGVSAVQTDPPTDFQIWLKRISPNMTWDWPYQKLIYKQLERITKGESRRLMIFLPPRHGKSELVTNRYAAWRLLNKPEMNIIIGSYNQRLANRFSRKVRITFEDALQREKDITAETQRRREDTRNVSHAGKSSLSPSVGNPSGEQQPSDPPRLGVSAVRASSSRPRLNTVSEWETGLGGGVRAVGVGGGITGFGADLVIIDDPIKSRAEAESKTYRERVWDWFNDDLYTRLEPNASIILIQTRWHEDDLAGRLLREASEEGGEHWDVISLPALAEESVTAETPRRAEDEINTSSGEASADPCGGTSNAEEKPSLPSRLGVLAVDHPPSSVLLPPKPPRQSRMFHNSEEWKAYDKKLAQYEEIVRRRQHIQSAKAETPKLSHPPCLGVSAVDPSSDPLKRKPGEALCPQRFTREDLLRIKRKLGSYSFSALYQQRPTPPEGGLFKRSWFKRIVDKPPQHLRWARGYDLAISTKDSADFTASVRCAFDRETGDLYIADGFRKKMEFPEQKRFVIEKLRTELNTEHGIEQALHGQAFVQELRRQPGLITRPIRLVRSEGDKFTRALSWANLAEEGKVVLVRGAWIDPFLDEICTFPNAAHDDQLDAVSTAVSMLQRHKRIVHVF